MLLVGVGGLGCPAALALARAGVPRLELMDGDVVDQTNLHRQPWHHLADVGRLKVDSAAQKLRRAFPGLEVVTHPRRLTAADAVERFGAVDLVIDGTDGVETKFLLSDAAVLSGTPLVYAGVLRFEGLALRIDPGGPCLRCLFEVPPDDVPTCAQAGVLGAMAGVMGGLQAQLALGPRAEGGVSPLHVVDGHGFSFRVVRVRRRADCAACGDGAKPVLREPEDETCPTPASTSPARSAP